MIPNLNYTRGQSATYDVSDFFLIHLVLVVCPTSNTLVLMGNGIGGERTYPNGPSPNTRSTIPHISIPLATYSLQIPHISLLYYLVFLKVHWRASLVTLAILFLQKIYLATFLAFSTTCNHSTKELSQGTCVTSQKQQTSPEILIYRLSEMRYWLTKEGSSSTTFFSTFLELYVSHTQKGVQLRWPKYG